MANDGQLMINSQLVINKQLIRSYSMMNTLLNNGQQEVYNDG